VLGRLSRAQSSARWLRPCLLRFPVISYHVSRAKIFPFSRLASKVTTSSFSSIDCAERFDGPGAAPSFNGSPRRRRQSAGHSVVTYGAASNLDDLLYLHNVDVAVTQADVFEYFRTQRKISNLESRVNYIIRLPVSEMHVLARADIMSIEDLRGKKVSFGPAGSASSLTGTIVFQLRAVGGKMKTPNRFGSMVRGFGLSKCFLFIYIFF
jgi:hypothetical protein